MLGVPSVVILGGQNKEDIFVVLDVKDTLGVIKPNEKNINNPFIKHVFN